MNFRKALILLCCTALLCFACKDKAELKLAHVTKNDFKKFIDATKYITDAERYGWSIVQMTIDTFKVVDKAIWTQPDGFDSTTEVMPITQVSYKDAMAYCKWAKKRLPTYEEYWNLVKDDKRPINISSNQILPAKESNIVGNTWDITSSLNSKGEVRLAGGSYLCSKHSCDGTNPNRELYVSPETGNAHISFVVVKP